jgi:CubicO group peptidase (beta-lactamase class C family)
MSSRRGVLGGTAALGALALASCTKKKPMTPAFTADGLAKLRAGPERHIAQGYAPGVVALISRGDQSHILPLGTKAFGDPAPMPRDAIFRIASMTKALTAAAVLMLVEDGKLRLDEPVDRLLPELAERRVLKRIDGPLDDTVPARRPITVEDLLTFREGFGIVFGEAGSTPMLQAIERLGICGFGRPNPSQPFGPDEWMKRLGTLPLMHQPGERWMYTTGSDIQGVLVARASGKTLPAFLQERIFAPLGMKDTAFAVPPEKLGRLVTAYGKQDGKVVASDLPAASLWAREPLFPEGDSGLVSTAEDYLAFARMLLAEGMYGDKRLLADASVRAMTTDHLTPTQRSDPDAEMILTKGHGWGYGLSVISESAPDGLPLDAFGWNGGFGTSWISDPRNDLTIVLLTQREFDGPDPPPIHKEFWAAAYKALG